jgi:hypothetical protein
MIKFSILTGPEDYLGTRQYFTNEVVEKIIVNEKQLEIQFEIRNEGLLFNAPVNTDQNFLLNSKHTKLPAIIQKKDILTSILLVIRIEDFQFEQPVKFKEKINSILEKQKSNRSFSKLIQKISD